MGQELIATIDQGTTRTKFVIFNKQGKMVAFNYRDHKQIYPHPGLVEHDPMEIWQQTQILIGSTLRNFKIKPENISTIGVTNQRETTVVWDPATGKPYYNAIVWQCTRTMDICHQLMEAGLEPLIRERTGLRISTYFSASKIKWILENVPDLKRKVEEGRVFFGNIDSWLIWNLTGGPKNGSHVTDYTNASRTMMFDIHRLDWDEELLEVLGVPKNILPEPNPSSQIYGYTDPKIFGATVPISGDIGDQQAALFGQAAFNEGVAKCTYGTGSFLLVNTGDKPYKSENLLTTIAWGIENNVTYALEGSIFISGAAIQWLKESLELIDDVSEVGVLASSVKSSEGVFFVPAFVGLGAPYWDQYARGLIIGLTRGTGRAHLARATFESIAYLTRSVLEEIRRVGIKISELKVDGGASKNDFLMQIQADMLGLRVVRPQILETTSLGAAYMAGLAVDYWRNLSEITSMWRAEKIFEPMINETERNKLYEAWKKAVEKSLGWAKILKEEGLE